MRHILSFDIAKGKSVYCFIDELRNVIIDASLIEHKKDEFDLSIRRLLNFGHTYAHIIERKSKYKISHGEAVAIGMYYELEGTEYQQVLLDLIQKYQLTNQLEKWNISYAADLKTDKKATSTKITMVELEAIGNAKLVDRSIL